MHKDLNKILVAYIVAIAVGACVLGLMESTPLWEAFMADLVATAVIFAFSRIYGNSSFYDAYWSVIPPLLVVYWVAAMPEEEVNLRQWLVIVLVWLWGARLTWNWASHWDGLTHEDWRYGPLREKAGSFAILVDFFGIHLFPTLEVFVACLPAYAAIQAPYQGLGFLDLLAASVVLAAIAIETVADLQLHAFIARRKVGEFITSGLWAYSRHPNYFGEMSFWWGLMFMGLAASPADWYWIMPGALFIAAMFVFISIPMMDARSLERRPAYADHMSRVSALVPWLPKH